MRCAASWTLAAPVSAMSWAKYTLTEAAVALVMSMNPRLPALVRSDVHGVRRVVHLADRDALLERADQSESLEGAAGLSARLHGQVDLVLGVVRSPHQHADATAVGGD